MVRHSVSAVAAHKCRNRHTFAFTLWQQAATSKFGTLSLVAVALQRIRHFIAFQCKLTDTARQTHHGTTTVFYMRPRYTYDRR